MPSNFIFYPIKKSDKFIKTAWCSYGNCFSLGAIYGISAILIWTKDFKIKDTLINLIKPVIRDAQIKEGPAKGAFYDTYFEKTKKYFY